MMLTEIPTEVGNYGMANVYLVYRNAGLFTQYYSYYFIKEEAEYFVNSAPQKWNIEEMSYAQFTLVRQSIVFVTDVGYFDGWMS